MGNPFLHVDRVMVRGGAAGFRATALINRNIHQHAARAHAAEHIPGNEPGCLGARNEYGGNEKIYARQQLHKVRLIRIECVGGMKRDVEKAHALHIDLKDGNVSAQTRGHAGGIDPGDSTAKHHDTAGQNAGYSAQQNSAAPMMLGQIIAADDDGHATGNLAHGLEQWQATVDLDGFKGNGGCA